MEGSGNRGTNGSIGGGFALNDMRAKSGMTPVLARNSTRDDLKRQASREYAWSVQTDSGIIPVSRTSNLIGK